LHHPCSTLTGNLIHHRASCPSFASNTNRQRTSEWFNIVAKLNSTLLSEFCLSSPQSPYEKKCCPENGLYSSNPQSFGSKTCRQGQLLRIRRARACDRVYYTYSSLAIATLLTSRLVKPIEPKSTHSQTLACPCELHLLSTVPFQACLP
jgi:hypothetical protein